MINKLSLKQTLYSLSLTLFVPAYGIMDVFKEKAYKAYENKMVYSAGVRSIDTIATALSRLLTYATYTTNTHALLEEKIKHRIVSIENKLKKAEEQCIKNLYKDFNISDERQIKIKTRTNLFKQFEKEYMSTFHEDITNDPNLVTEILPLLKALNIHPHGIKIEISSDPSPLLPLAHATSQGLKARFSIINDALIIKEIISPTCITIHPRGLNQLKINPKSLLAHEIGHIAAQQHITVVEIIHGISIFANTTQEHIIANKNFQQLVTIYEQQAEILYKNAHYASAIREYRATDYYPNQLFLGHYAQVVEIDELYKLTNQLKNYKKFLYKQLL